MDVNNVLPNSRQFFQGISLNSPASGELAPGASVGYNSPPVSSTATSTVISAANPYPPYQQISYSQQASWTPSNGCERGVIAKAGTPHFQNMAGIYKPPSLPSASLSYSRNTNQPTRSVPYHSYENSGSMPKMLPSTTPSYDPQHSYSTPSITRLKDSPNQGIYNMDSVVCQPNANQTPNKKTSKVKAPALTPSTGSSSPGSYKQPSHPEDSRRFSQMTPSSPLSSYVGMNLAPRVSSVVAVSHSAIPTHQTYPNYQHVNFEAPRQQQTSYHSIHTKSIEKVSHHDPTDVRFRHYRCIETTSVERAPALPPKRDSPLDLSVKTIRQSADSTAHDDAENAMYSHLYPRVAQHPTRPEGCHPHLPQLPFNSSMTLVKSRPQPPTTVINNGVGRHRQPTHLSSSPSLLSKGYPETAYTGFANGQIVDNRLPVSEICNEMTLSVTYEQEQRALRTQISAQISTTQYSQYIPHPTENKAKIQDKAQLPAIMVNGPLAGHPSHSEFLDSRNHPIQFVPTPIPPNRKRKQIADPSLPTKNPRTCPDWRESIDKEIENRLNAYTTQKAKEEEQQRQQQLVSQNNDSNSYHEIRSSPTAASHINSHERVHQTYETAQKVNNRSSTKIHGSILPQAQSSTQPWYPPQMQRPQHSYSCNDSQFSASQPISLPRNREFDERSNAALPSRHQKPLPPFRNLALKNLQEMKVETEKDTLKVAFPVPVELPARKPVESQSREALLASALTHPRIRTKAELKQVTPVDKLKNGSLIDIRRPVDSLIQNAIQFQKRQTDSEILKTVERTDVIGIDCNLLSTNVENVISGHRPLLEATLTASALSQDPSKSYSPKKKLFAKTSVSQNIKQTSSELESAVFEFKGSDSETETGRLKRESLQCISAEPTVAEELHQVEEDDSKWLEACNELIEQFSNNNRKKRGRKKKVVVDDMIELPEKKSVSPERSYKCEVENKPLIELDLIKEEKVENKLKEKEILKDARLEKFIIETEKKNELSGEDEDEKSSDDERSEKECRGRRSNVSTTRLRIQNSLNDSFDSDKEEMKDDDDESADEGEEINDDDEDSEENELDDDDEDEEDTKFKNRISKKVFPTKHEISMRKKLNKRVPTKKAILKKKKKIMKKKKIIKGLASKKLKKVDMKREKMRNMILRRMETRRSKIEAIKILKKSKCESSFNIPEEVQPIRTRKMAQQESQKEKKHEIGKQKYVASSANIKILLEKNRVETTKNCKRLTRLMGKMQSDTGKTESKKPTKKNKVKSFDEKSEAEEEPMKRTLRSRNVIVPEEKHIKKLKKDEKEKDREKEDKEKSKLTPKKNDKQEKSKGVDSKDREKEKSKKNKKASEEDEKNSSWEEELFKYKYSLRMPVKLINISGPNNWPKSGGSASSLPDLDRNETDSDILKGISKHVKTPRKKNEDEEQFSHTQEFKDSVKYLQQKFDQKIEEKNHASNLTKLMMEKKMKIIPKSCNGPELLPTPGLDSFRAKLKLTTKKEKKGKASSKTDDDDETEEVVEDSFIEDFRKETVDGFKDVFEKHKVTNQFATVILESRTRTQTKELKYHATLKQVFGCDRPASAPPVSDSNELSQSPKNDVANNNKILTSTPLKESTANGAVKPWHRSLAKFRYLIGEDGADSDKDSRDFEDGVDFVVGQEEDGKDMDVTAELVVKKKNRSFRRKCRSSGFDYIRKKKKQKKEDDDELMEEKEKKKITVNIRTTPESIEDIQNEIKSWVVNKGIGETVLHKAARLGYLDVSSYCLEKLNCSPSPTDNAGYTPLHEACTRGHLRIAKMLLKYGADVSASAKGGIRPLHEAVENGNVELVRLLLSYGADPLLSTYGGQTPLSLVKEDGDDLREFLLLYLADIQGNPSKPWHFSGIDYFDEELIGYNPLENPPPPVFEENECLQFEMSDSPLPSLYQFRNEFDYWILSTDLPARIRDLVTKRISQDDTSSQFVIRKINRSQFEEDVCSVMLLDNKHFLKSKVKSPTITLVKYNDKLLSTLNIQKISMTFS